MATLDIPLEQLPLAELIRQQRIACNQLVGESCKVHRGMQNASGLCFVAGLEYRVKALFKKRAHLEEMGPSGYPTGREIAHVPIGLLTFPITFIRQCITWRVEKRRNAKGEARTIHRQEIRMVSYG